MSLTILEHIEIEAPEYLQEPKLSMYIVSSEEQTSTNYGIHYNRAVALRVCHTYKKRDMNGGDSTNSGSGSSGAVMSEKEGSVSRSYSNVSGLSNSIESELATTVFGTKLIDLTKGIIVAVII